ncbi:MAG: MBL fold metallo-hydrolase [Thermoanaerobaculia bacterium]
MLARLFAAATVLLLSLAAHAEAPPRGGQAPGWYRMTLGKFEVTALSDGTVQAPVDQLLRNIKPEQEKSLLARLPEVAGRDLGQRLSRQHRQQAGADRHRRRRAVRPYAGQAAREPEGLGLHTPEQVDEVYITHLHPDHTGGLATADGKAVFPNAVVRLDAENGDYWLSRKNLDAAPAGMKSSFQGAMASMKPYVEAGRFKPFRGATELVPGIRSIPTYGHTPGHTIYAIESEGQKLVVWGDMVHVAAVQLPQPTATWVESDPKLAMRQRLKSFADAAKNGYYVALAHVAFPGIGRLRTEGKGYIWVPAVYSNAGAAVTPDLSAGATVPEVLGTCSATVRVAPGPAAASRRLSSSIRSVRAWAMAGGSYPIRVRPCCWIPGREELTRIRRSNL